MASNLGGFREKAGSWIAALALSVAISEATLAQTPSFDCAKASLPLDRLICSSPSLSSLDAEMSTAFKTAADSRTADDKAALLSRQRQWLRDRVRICPLELLENGTAEKCLADLYRDRIAGLSQPDAGMSAGDPVCDELAKRVKSAALNAPLETALSYKLLRYLDMHSAGFFQLNAMRDASKEEIKLLSEEFAPKSNRATTLSLKGSSIMATYFSVGSLNCQRFTFHEKVNGRGITPIVAPLGAESGEGTFCADDEGQLATIGGKPGFVEVESLKMERIHLNFTPWEKGAWGETCKVQLQFNTRLEVGEGQCRDVDCDKLRIFALNYDAKKSALSNAMPPSLAEHYEKMEALDSYLKRFHGMFQEDQKKAFSSDDWNKMHAYSDVPFVGREPDESCREWDYPEDVFPIVLGNDVLLGRYGHPFRCWDINGARLFAAYQLRNGELYPVAGFRILTVREDVSQQP